MTEDGHDISIDEAENDGYVKNPDNDVWELKEREKMHSIIEMLRYMRPHSVSQRQFCKRFFRTCVWFA